jgi:DNA-binding transcriptional ArsR family regulator
LKILYFLTRHELCVADLATLVGMGQSAVSHQLKVLRMNRLVKVRKDGPPIITLWMTNTCVPFSKSRWNMSTKGAQDEDAGV